MMTTFKEGHVFNAYNLTVSPLRGQKVNAPALLSANKQSRFEKISANEHILNSVYQPRQVCSVVDTVVGQRGHNSKFCVYECNG